MGIFMNDGTIQYEGAVLAKWMDNSYRVMSDVWCPAEKILVWRAEGDKEVPRELVVNVFFNDIGEKAKVEVDATEEVKQKYYAYLVDMFRKQAVEAAQIKAAEVKRWLS